jgi:trehalose 6-phosphate synthase
VADDRGSLLRELLGASGRLIVLSNRGPITFEHDPRPGGPLTAARGSGGLVTALGDLGRHAPLTWVAAALSPADREVAPVLHRLARGETNGHPHGLAARVRDLLEETVPGQDLHLHLVDLPPEMFEPYYSTIANPFLWFIAHRMYQPAYGPNIDDEFLAAWRGGYRPVNEKLAQAALDAAGDTPDPVVLVQDYHLYLAPATIRDRRPGATILHFTHIPWPGATEWQLLPSSLRRPIVEGLLASDIVGMQTDHYATNFLETVEIAVRDARVEPDGRTVRWRGRRIPVRTYPISIDPDGLSRFSRSPAVEERVGRLRERLDRAGDPLLIVRADRIEPSKNILRGFLAFEALLHRRPDLRRRVRFLAVQASSRTEISEYAQYAAAVREVVARINGLAEPDEAPVWIADGSDYAMAIAAMRLADVVLVNPLVDGMNLVAKEAVIVGQRDPVLVLSETAGAAEQLASDSLVVAPADVSGTASQLERALTMGVDERRGHLRNLRASVRQEDIRWWLDRQLRDLAAIRRGQGPPSRRLRDTLRRVEVGSPG